MGATEGHSLTGGVLLMLTQVGQAAIRVSPTENQGHQLSQPMPICAGEREAGEPGPCP